MVPGGGADCWSILILNKLLKILDAQDFQYAGNAVLEYATSTQDFERVRSVRDGKHLICTE